MDLLWRIAQVIVPVFLIVAVGWAYGRRTRPDLTIFNRIVLDVLSPLLVYTALARAATPVVRYRSRDHALVTGVDRCACGRTSPRIRCIGRTDDMLIYRGMNVFPTAIRDLVVEAFAGRCEPLVRLWRELPGQVRFDDPIAVEVEAAPSIDAAIYKTLGTEMEELVRARLQVRIAVQVVPPGTLPRAVYKSPLLVTRQ